MAADRPPEGDASDRFGAAFVLLTVLVCLTGFALLVIGVGTLTGRPEPPDSRWREPMLFPADHPLRAAPGAAAGASDFVPGLERRVPPQELLVLEDR